MEIALAVVGVWIAGLTVFVWLKMRQPKHEYPKPSERDDEYTDRGRDAAA